MKKEVVLAVAVSLAFVSFGSVSLATGQVTEPGLTGPKTPKGGGNGGGPEIPRFSDQRVNPPSMPENDR
jgi:hypothetical protein